MCSVPGCEKPVCAKGWCEPHYRRFKRHGDPEGGRTPPGESTEFFERVVLRYTGDECLKWPYSRTKVGYALLYKGGQNRLVSRLVCMRIFGPPPNEDWTAAHGCGNGHLGCVAPRHLRWATHKDNCADRAIHGTDSRGERNGASRLSRADVREIRESVLPRTELANQFRVTPGAIRHVQTGKTWGWLP